jgi:hypothetical protein
MIQIGENNILEWWGNTVRRGCCISFEHKAVSNPRWTQVPFTGADGLGTPVSALAPGATFG